MNTKMHGVRDALAKRMGKRSTLWTDAASADEVEQITFFFLIEKLMTCSWCCIWLAFHIIQEGTMSQVKWIKFLKNTQRELTAPRRSEEWQKFAVLQEKNLQIASFRPCRRGRSTWWCSPHSPLSPSHFIRLFLWRLIPERHHACRSFCLTNKPRSAAAWPRCQCKGANYSDALTYEGTSSS